ncbi:MAG: hypothetical protein PHQ00_07430, partial [Phycisphaerae bacterium]|nr:hypothetical protein [Phycisphaerae bacterium]
MDTLRFYALFLMAGLFVASCNASDKAVGTGEDNKNDAGATDPFADDDDDTTGGQSCLNKFDCPPGQSCQNGFCAAGVTDDDADDDSLPDDDDNDDNDDNDSDDDSGGDGTCGFDISEQENCLEEYCQNADESESKCVCVSEPGNEACNGAGFDCEDKSVVIALRCIADNFECDSSTGDATSSSSQKIEECIGSATQDDDDNDDNDIDSGDDDDNDDCVADCAGKSCGDDGCGATCGDCGENQYCNEGVCECDTGKPLCGTACCSSAEECATDVCCPDSLNGKCDDEGAKECGSITMPPKDFRTCGPDENGCFVWTDFENCGADEICRGEGVCGKDECQIGQTQCHGDDVEACEKPDGELFNKWVVQQTCSASCASGRCIGCASNLDCTDPYPICNLMTHACVGCTTDTDCTDPTK